MSKISFKKFTLAIATSVLLVSCSSPLSQTPLCELTEIKTTTKQSQKLNISVHVDGSGSMLGYVKPSNTAYIQALNLLGDTLELSEGLHKENILNYYRNGESDPLITRSEYRKAQLPLFYDGTDKTFPAVSSPIHEAVKEPSEEDDLIVIITDLEQDQGDVTKLTKNLQQYLNKNKNYSVGIWAVKSEFEGKVYLENAQSNLGFKEYNTNNKSVNEYRPFYILFVGISEDIEYYFDKISNSNPQLSNSDQGHLLIFNPHHLVSQLTSIKNLPELPQGLDNPVSLSDGTIQAYQDPNNPYQLLKITSVNEENYKLNFSLPLASLKYTLPPDPTSLETTNLVKTFDYNSEADDKFVEETQTPSLKEALEINNWNIEKSDNKLTFTTTIKPDKIESNLVYLYDLNIKASGLQIPPWWSEWSWQSLDQQNGSKTQNLERFLIQLKDISLESMTENDQNVTIGKLCFAINKD